MPLEVIESPFRATSPPLARYLHDLHAENPDLTMNLVLPKLVPASALQRPLHNGVARRLTKLMRTEPGSSSPRFPSRCPAEHPLRRRYAVPRTRP